MKVLITCKESQVVTKAFRALGHEAYSCDIQHCYGEHPEWHIHKSVEYILPGSWDLIIAHPTCTYLCKAQLWRCNRSYTRMFQKRKAIDFVKHIWNRDCPRICIENPDGCLPDCFRPWDQRTSFRKFEDKYRKDICLWLKGLPKLIEGSFVTGTKSVSNHVNSRMDQATKSHIKSRFFTGIARAMAKQWGALLSPQVTGN